MPIICCFRSFKTRKIREQRQQQLQNLGVNNFIIDPTMNYYAEKLSISLCTLNRHRSTIMKSGGEHRERGADDEDDDDDEGDDDDDDEGDD